MIKYLILGGGPSGLSFANRLLDKKIDDFLVLEQESEAGGLCRSRIVDGFPLDIGGGHFLDVKRNDVNEFLFGFMPIDEWNVFERDSRIAIFDKLIGHPFESNIWQLDIEDQIRYLKSISQSGSNAGKSMPTDFLEWIQWKLGDEIANDYMIPYNQKMFGDDLNELGTYWLEKLPSVSFEETLRSCLSHHAFGTLPGHANFYYPKKFGYGELWKRMGDKLGDHIVYDCRIKALDIKNRRIITKTGEEYLAEIIINTVPLTSLALKGADVTFTDEIKRLKHTSVVIEYNDGDINNDAHWVYYPDSSITYHRILVRRNFCIGSRGYWTETNAERFEGNLSSDTCFYNEYAYPLNTVDKPMVMKKVLSMLQENQIYGLGRWGEWEHYNSDVVVQRAMGLADALE